MNKNNKTETGDNGRIKPNNHQGSMPADTAEQPVVRKPHPKLAVRSFSDHANQNSGNSATDSDSKKAKRPSLNEAFDALVEKYLNTSSFSFRDPACMTLEANSSVYYPIKGEEVDEEVGIFLLSLGIHSDKKKREPVTDSLSFVAKRHGKNIHLRTRIFQSKKAIYYLAAQNPPNIYRIGAKNIRKAPCFHSAGFLYSEVLASQVKPDLSVKPEEFLSLLRQAFRVDEAQIHAFAAHLVSFFVPRIPSPVMIISGSKGTAKTTTTKQICSLVSPTISISVQAFPTKESDLVAAVSDNYLTAFDNVAFPIKPSLSDILCQIITGGTYAKRRLYTDNGRFKTDLQGKLIFNGIDELAAKDDFAERCFQINLEPISPDERKTDAEISKNFEALRPKLLGCIFNILREVQRVEEIEEHPLPRMAEFGQFGQKVMKVIKAPQKAFVEEYNESVEDLVADASERMPIVLAVKRALQDSDVIKGTPTNVAEILNDAAKEERIKMVLLTANSVTKTLKKNRDALEHNGITFELPEGRTNKRWIHIRHIDGAEAVGKAEKADLESEKIVSIVNELLERDENESLDNL